MLAHELDAEAGVYLGHHRNVRHVVGHALVVRIGTARPCEVAEGSGPIEVDRERGEGSRRPGLAWSARGRRSFEGWLDSRFPRVGYSLCHNRFVPRAQEGASS